VIPQRKLKRPSTAPPENGKNKFCSVFKSYTLGLFHILKANGFELPFGQKSKNENVRDSATKTKKL